MALLKHDLGTVTRENMSRFILTALVVLIGEIVGDQVVLLAFSLVTVHQAR